MPKCLGPKSLGLLVPKWFGEEMSVTLIFAHHFHTLIVPVIQKGIVGVLCGRRLNYVTQCWLLPVHRTSPLRSRHHSLKEIFEFFLKLSAETEKRTPINWFCIFFHYSSYQFSIIFG